MVTPTSWTLAPDVAVLLSGHRIALLVLVLATVLLPATWVTGRVIDGLQEAPAWARRSLKAVALVLTPYAGIVAVAGTFSPFLYFQF